MMKNTKKKAFTLIELLVVIAIIGILATLAVVSLQNARARARDSKRVADVKQMQTALELYFNDYNSYPENIEGGISSGTDNVYMATKPTYPTPNDCTSTATTTYVYTPKGSNPSFTSYTISFCLGSKTGELEAGVNCATPGGISHSTSTTCN